MHVNLIVVLTMADAVKAFASINEEYWRPSTVKSMINDTIETTSKLAIK